METFHLTVEELRDACPRLSAGDLVILSGTVYTSRDAAHKKIFSLLDEGRPLPYPLQDAVIYYAGPTPAPEGMPIGSCGPTTSKRMDPYTARLYDLGVCATVGKGGRAPDVSEAIIRNKAVYLCAIGGAGALAAQSVTSCEVIAFPELGCESVKRLTFHNFPLYVGIDCGGGTLFNHNHR